jgi:hypothetical protein
MLLAAPFFQIGREQLRTKCATNGNIKDMLNAVVTLIFGTIISQID